MILVFNMADIIGIFTPRNVKLNFSVLFTANTNGASFFIQSNSDQTSRFEVSLGEEDNTKAYFITYDPDTSVELFRETIDHSVTLNDTQYYEIEFCDTTFIFKQKDGVDNMFEQNVDDFIAGSVFVTEESSVVNYIDQFQLSCNGVTPTPQPNDPNEELNQTYFSLFITFLVLFIVALILSVVFGVFTFKYFKR